VAKGGYDDGYKSCSCFWGREPGSLIRKLEEVMPSFEGALILDAGCGEGKNAAYLAGRGAIVRAIDISPHAIENAIREFGSVQNVSWEIGDVRELQLTDEGYQAVIAYGIMHCLINQTEVQPTISKLQRATKVGGYNIVCAFNNRFQDLSAHPDFAPTLLDHIFYVNCYADWELVYVSDSDLTETHPNNNIVHTHSMTRILARKIR
jgi:ubiquinone/menaquinone biosynthesis C-methylase UbiE